jgi:hypothetical protein
MMAYLIPSQQVQQDWDVVLIRKARSPVVVMVGIRPTITVPFHHLHAWALCHEMLATNVNTNQCPPQSRGQNLANMVMLTFWTR